MGSDELTEAFVEEMEAIKARIQLESNKIYQSGVKHADTHMQTNSLDMAYAKVEAQLKIEHRVRTMLALESIAHALYHIVFDDGYLEVKKK